MWLLVSPSFGHDLTSELRGAIRKFDFQAHLDFVILGGRALRHGNADSKCHMSNNADARDIQSDEAFLGIHWSFTRAHSV